MGHGRSPSASATRSAPRPRARGSTSSLGPTVNILRTPKWGRAAETFGEDPYPRRTDRRRRDPRHAAPARDRRRSSTSPRTTRRSAASAIRRDAAVLARRSNVRGVRARAAGDLLPGVQGGGAAGARGVGDVLLPAHQRPLRVREPVAPGHAEGRRGASRASSGPMRSLAVRDTLAAANAGTDNFLLGGIGVAAGRQALQQVSAERLDDMVRRILTAMFSVGLFDHPERRRPRRRRDDAGAHARSPRRSRAQGSVLLKNDGGAAAARRGRRLDRRHRLRCRAGHADHGRRLAGRRRRAGRVAARRRSPRAPVHGVHGDLRAGTLGVVPLPIVPAERSHAVVRIRLRTVRHVLRRRWIGAARSLRTFVEPTLDFGKRARHRAVLGALDRHAHAAGDRDVPLLARLRGRRAAVHRRRSWSRAATSEGTRPPRLPGRRRSPRRALATLTRRRRRCRSTIEYSIGSSFVGSALHLGWQPPDPALLAEAVAAARASDVAVVFVNDVTSEGMDRDSLALPGDQDALIAAVAAVNPRTIVVLHTAGPVLMPWLAQVAAVIQAWYPGQETGHAIAAVLFGDVAPVRPAADDLPGAARRRARPRSRRSIPASTTPCSYDEGDLRRLSLLRPVRAGAAVPVRLRPLLHHASRSTGLQIVRRRRRRATRSRSA